MKAFINLAVHCPECNGVMWREIDSQGQRLKCIFNQCKNFEVKFKAPTIELEYAEQVTEKSTPRLMPYSEDLGSLIPIEIKYGTLFRFRGNLYRLSEPG